MEALEKLEDPDQREFSLSIRQVGQFLVILAENRYVGALSFHSGLPQTTKADRDYHGFGMQSIRHIVEKYEGELLLKTEDQTFRLKIVFPLEGRIGQLGN